MSKIFDALKEAELENRSRQGSAATRENSAPALFVVPATTSADPIEPHAKPRQALNLNRVSRGRIWLFLGLLLISAAATFLRHYARGVGNNRQSAEIKSAASVPDARPPVEQPASAPPPVLSSNVPGFVLQVAAMRHESNADALEKTLRQKNFPAFVFRRGASRFYQVAVGVYVNAASAGRVKDELATQGFKPVLRRWLPE